MEFFVIINFLVTIYLLFQISSLKKRLKDNGKNAIPENIPVTATQNQSLPSVIMSENEPKTASGTTTVQSRNDEDDALTKFINWLRTDWMLKLGGFFMLLAAGWFVTYAFMNNWIGETGRIVLGILAGSAFMTWGVLRMKKVMREGEIILSVGAVILVTSIFAGQHMYHLYPDSVSLVATTFVAIVISVIAYINKREILALFGVLMIGVSPLLAGYDSVTPNVTGLLTYLLCMILGVIWLSKVTGWRSVTFVSVAVVAFYFAPYCMQYKNYIEMTTARYSGYYMSPPKLHVDVDILRFFAIVFAIIFNMSSFVTLLFEKKANRDDFPLVAMSAAFVAFSLYTLSTPDLLAIKLAVLAILYMGLAVILTRMTKYSYYVELYATVSILFLVYATIKAAKMEFLPTAFAIEAIALTLFYKYSFGKPYPVVSVLLYGGSFIITLGGIFDVGRTWTATVGFVATLISTYFPYTLSKIDLQKSHDKTGEFAEGLSLVLGNVLAALGFYNFVENVGDKIGYTRSLIKGIRYAVYAIVGSFLYFMSRAPGQHQIKNLFGLGFIIYVVASLLLYEVWSMDIAARIVIFFLIGLLFISSIYFLKMYEKKN